MSKLSGVHPALLMLFQELERRGAPKFGYSEGVRSRERQKELVAEGKSQTMNSRHLHGGALDIHLLDESGKPDWNFDRYQDFWENHVRPVSQELGIPVEWGGNWKTLKDGVHFQLPRSYRMQAEKQISMPPGIPKMDPGVPTPAPGVLDFANITPKAEGGGEWYDKILDSDLLQSLTGAQQQQQAPAPAPLPQALPPETFQRRGGDSYAKSLMEMLLSGRI